MADMDAASEALMRKLHRELNGLTRSTRNAPGTLDRMKSAQKPKNDARSAGRKSATPCSQEGSGSEASSSGSEGKDDKPSKKLRKTDASPDPQPKLSRQASPACQSVQHALTTSAGQARKPPDGQKKLLADKERQKPAAAKGKPSVDLTGPASSVQQQVFGSALEAAAAMASVVVKDKVRIAASRGQASGQRLVKCFHAGVRWGITLAPEALKTRADLATALNDAFAGEILSCGRGEILNIVLLDGDGKVAEFPSLRSSGARDSSSKWKASVERAIKIYVRRG